MTKIATSNHFPTVVMALAAIAALFIVAFGYGTMADSLSRTQFIVLGMERIVMALAVAAMIHWGHAILSSTRVLGRQGRSSGSMSSSS
jgi:hypothetical protein